MTEQLEMMKKLLTSKYPNIDIQWEHHKREIFKTSTGLVRWCPNHTTLKFPTRYRDEVLLISKMCGIFWEHEYFEEMNGDEYYLGKTTFEI